MQGLSSFGQQQVVGDGKQVGPEGSSGLIAARSLKDGDERVLRELLGARSVDNPPPEEAPDRTAIAIEQQLECLVPALLHGTHQIFVASHGTFRSHRPANAGQLACLPDTVMS